MGSVYLQDVWVLISIVSSLIGGIWGLFVYISKKPRKKPRVKMRATTQQYDHAKGLNACIHPVNKLLVSIVNTSDVPLIIREIKFEYSSKRDQAKLVYDNFSFKKRNEWAGKTLLKSQEAYLSLSYNETDDKHVLDNLKSIILVSSYSRRYRLKGRRLRSAIKEVKALPPPHPDNLALDFEGSLK